MTADFAAEIGRTLDEGRALAESLMQDTFVVERKTGRTEQNEETGAEGPAYETLFVTPGRLKDMGYADSDTDVGGRREAVGSTAAHMPWNVGNFRTNDRIRVTAIGPRTAARHLGKTYYIGTDHDRSDATATRLVVKSDPWT